jgi:Zn-dependent membrane protease YugP
MRPQRLNLLLGGIGIVVASLGGFALGIGHAFYFAEGYYKIDLVRALLKDAHNHGQPFALFNLVVGILLPHLALGARGKAWLSGLAAASLLLPVGLLARGLAGGSMAFAPITFTGGIAFMAAAALIAVGAFRMGTGPAA